LPFDDAYFDLVICTEVIEHIKDVESSQLPDLESFNYSGVINMLSEIRRVLVKSGYLVLTTPNASSMLTLDKWLHGEILLMDPHHVREFTTHDLNRVAHLSALRTHSISVINSWENTLDPNTAEIRQYMLCNPAFASVQRGDNILAVFSKE
jgi:2-polyprenyl-3-methyl-5-hydroxy-6-metoxy-1,4-benzoquinol methylase